MAQQAAVIEDVEATAEDEPAAPAAPPPEQDPDASPSGRARGLHPGMVAAAAGAAVLAIAAAAAAMRVAHPQLRAGEELRLSVQPRRAIRRYLGSLGLWELQRQATRYTVTDERLVIQHGVMGRVLCTVPLDAIRTVILKTGPWEGFVRIQTGAKQGPLERTIGPLRSPAARRLAAAVDRHREGGA